MSKNKFPALDKNIYPMCDPQPVQLDCRLIDCAWHKNGACTNAAPLITINPGLTVCWTKIVSE